MATAKMSQNIMVGTSTDIGKTYVTCNIIKYHQNNNKDLEVIKPIITGFDPQDEKCDTVKILHCLNKEINDNNIESVSPFRLKTPISPISAAAIENRKIDYLDVLNFCQSKIKHSITGKKNLIIETAGGVMTPICPGKTFLDLVQDLDIGVILVGACFLGGISSILTSYESLKSRNINNIKIVINNHLNHNDESLKITDFVAEVSSFVDCEVFLVDNFFI